MDVNKLVGSSLTQWAAFVLGTLSVFAVVANGRGVWPNGSELALWTGIVSGVLAFIAFVHTSRAIYRRWMMVAAALHQVVVTVLFGACYLIIVPVFALMIRPFDVLRLRRSSRAETFWVERRNRRCDIESLQRLG